MNYLLLELPIGLNIQEILLHLLNFAILLIGIRYLLYKPVKNFISKREKEYKDREEGNKQAKEQALEEKAKYEALAAEAQRQVAKIAEEAAVITKKNSSEILEQARVEAKAIVANAAAQAKQEADKIMPELRNKSSELGLAIAEKILTRKITEKDMDKLIDECLMNWSKQ